MAGTIAGKTTKYKNRNPKIVPKEKKIMAGYERTPSVDRS
jgi:hypothetical protein